MFGRVDSRFFVGFLDKVASPAANQLRSQNPKSIAAKSSQKNWQCKAMPSCGYKSTKWSLLRTSGYPLFIPKQMSKRNWWIVNLFQIQYFVPHSPAGLAIYTSSLLYVLYWVMHWLQDLVFRKCSLCFFFRPFSNYFQESLHGSEFPRSFRICLSTQLSWPVFHILG